MTVSCCFRAELMSVAAARSWLTAALSELAPGAALDDAQLCVSELASNAVRHTGTDFEVAIDRLEDRIRITVADGSGVEPILRTVDPDTVTGRGLLVVDAVAHRWGVEPRGSAGKGVWYELPITARR